MRWVSKSAREHPGQQGMSKQPGPFELLPGSIPHPNDMQALLRYREEYDYDTVGNIERIIHATTQSKGSPGPSWTLWTRRYDDATDSNRLLRTSLPGDAEDTFSAIYEYANRPGNNAGLHGSMTRMPHLPEIEWDYADRMQHANKLGGGDVFFTYDGSG